MIKLESLASEWQDLLSDTIKYDYFTKLLLFLETEYRNNTVYPSPDLVFSAFNLTLPDKVKVVIIGQDPYHGEEQAHGLAFSVPDGIKIPPSLKNIYKELYSDLNIPISQTGNLTNWAKQGVLLMNAALTVKAKSAGSHQKKGWEQFTDSIISRISDTKEHVVFLLWGNYAKTKKQLIDCNKHKILEAPHPSPLSARMGFFGCKHFSQTNNYLKSKNKTEIDWTVKDSSSLWT